MHKFNLIFSARSGFSGIYHKGRFILFGGVTDIDESEDGIKSICHDDMYNLNIEGNRWFPFTLKLQKADEVPHARPCPRFNAMTVIIKNTFYLFGGIVEAGSKEYTLSDLWTIQLDKMVQWMNPIEDDISHIDWKADESEHESDNDSIDTDDTDDSDGDGDDDEEVDSDCESIAVPEDDPESLSDIEERVKEEEKQHQLSLDKNTTPLSTENLGKYFSRTQQHWEVLAFARKYNTGKILRKEAFDMAQVKYEEWKESVKGLEELELEDVDLQMREESAGGAGKEGTLRPRR